MSSPLPSSRSLPLSLPSIHKPLRDVVCGSSFSSFFSSFLPLPGFCGLLVSSPEGDSPSLTSLLPSHSTARMSDWRRRRAITVISCSWEGGSNSTHSSPILELLLDTVGGEWILVGPIIISLSPPTSCGRGYISQSGRGRERRSSSNICLTFSPSLSCLSFPPIYYTYST